MWVNSRCAIAAWLECIQEKPRTVSEWTGLPGEESVKRFERFNGLDTALYKTIPLPFYFTLSFIKVYNYDWLLSRSALFLWLGYITFNKIWCFLTTANTEQIDKATDIVKKLQFAFSSENFENPALQQYYVNVEAMALDYDEPDKVSDYTSKSLGISCVLHIRLSQWMIIGHSVLRNAFFWKCDAHPLLCNVNNIAPYTFVMLIGAGTYTYVTPNCIKCNTWMTNYGRSTTLGLSDVTLRCFLEIPYST